MSMAVKTFQRAETVICTLAVRDNDGNLCDPATSMTATITGPTGASVVNAAAMTKDDVGLYHYDYQPAADAVLGTYRVRYTATDGTRVTIQTDTFLLE